jgi:bacterioferritin (cytochrome b1)
VVNHHLGAADRTRRTLFGGGAAAAGALLLSACGGKKAPAPFTPSAPPKLGDADIAILNGLLDQEYKAIAAYTAGIPLLDSTAHDAAKQFLQHELYHASKLYSMIKHAGGEPHKQKANYPLGHPRTGEDVLRLLHALEHDLLAAYLEAVPVVSTGSARAVLAATLANEAQHVAVVRSELDLDPLTGAFVSGRG